MRLECAVQHYAWGSVTSIPELLGVEPDGQPWAELWIGAHPIAPSKLPDGRRLDEAIAADPGGWLGGLVVEHMGPRLPFLLKVLAAGEPLSLQAHPSELQAKEGFAREQALGIALDDPKRIYKDPHHKPELLCALTEFHALCGFRPVHRTLEMLEQMEQARGLQPFGGVLRRTASAADGLRSVVEQLLTMAVDEQRRLVDETASACASHRGPFEAEAKWMIRLAQRYPGDIGSVISLFLNLVKLRPGQAIGLTSGNLHAYLQGTGVELMANSDNVLRGGLTPKHIDVPELLHILDCTPLAEPILRSRHLMGGSRYAIAADEFRLDRFVRDGGDPPLDLAGPVIVMSSDGRPMLDERVLEPGRPEIVRADRRARLTGTGTVFVAGVNL